MIAALYVQTGGCYFGLDGVDPWDEERDARKYDGPHAVVAHPPCARWCQFASVVEARYGYAIGDDGGTFAAALASVRKWGGVLEHPAYTLAWEKFGLPTPIRNGWTRGLFDNGWVTEVSQSAYGHRARKRTWLYYVGPKPPSLDWRDPSGEACLGWGDYKKYRDVPRLERRESSATPQKFRALLLDLAKASS